MSKSRVELERNDWQTLVNLLGSKCLFNEVAPLIGQIMQQLNTPAPPPANGAEQQQLPRSTPEQQLPRSTPEQQLGNG